MNLNPRLLEIMNKLQIYKKFHFCFFTMKMHGHYTWDARVKEQPEADVQPIHAGRYVGMNMNIDVSDTNLWLGI